MAARVSSTSSEMSSSSEDSASEDPVNMIRAKRRGADLKETAIRHNEHKCEYDSHEICKYFQIMFCLLTSLDVK